MVLSVSMYDVELLVDLGLWRRIGCSGLVEAWKKDFGARVVTEDEKIVGGVMEGQRILGF